MGFGSIGPRVSGVLGLDMAKSNVTQTLGDARRSSFTRAAIGFLERSGEHARARLRRIVGR